MNLSKHLTSEELVCRCGKCELSDPDKVAKLVHPQVIEKFIQVRLALRVPIIITRGVSCWEHHKSIYIGKYGDDWESHITKESKHLVKDGHFSGIDCVPIYPDLYRCAGLFAYFRWMGIILYPSFIHADVGQRSKFFFKDNRG